MDNYLFAFIFLASRKGYIQHDAKEFIEFKQILQKVTKNKSFKRETISFVAQ